MATEIQVLGLKGDTQSSTTCVKQYFRNKQHPTDIYRKVMRKSLEKVAQLFR
jgi:hypothetical protein